MAPRDPNKTARNRRIAEIKEERRAIQDQVFNELKNVEDGKYCNEESLNAFIGSKIDDYIDLRNDVIKTPMEFASKWLKGLKEAAERSNITYTEPRHNRMLKLLKGRNPFFKKYVSLFLEGSFLKHYETHYKVKPKIDESEYWFGNNSDEFGLLVTPRFVENQWENDKSEIRHFKYPYWTISHIINVGLCYLNCNEVYSFSKLEDYLQFFRRMVRMTKSTYQLQIAEKYIDYVTSSDHPESIPLLIPELRYDPFKNRHEHRLDFLIINPWNMSKIGFEFSPWSTHGELTGAGKKLKEYNEEAKANFEKEMKKHKKYWRKYGVNYLTYTDEDLSDIDSVWEEIKKYLEIPRNSDQLELQLMNELLG
jgi:hypothetical protein